jgi:hypothetical protein
VQHSVWIGTWAWKKTWKLWCEGVLSGERYRRRWQRKGLQHHILALVAVERGEKVETLKRATKEAQGEAESPLNLSCSQRGHGARRKKQTNMLTTVI